MGYFIEFPAFMSLIFNSDIWPKYIKRTKKCPVKYMEITKEKSGKM